MHFNGGTEIDTALQCWLARKGITFSTSSPYIHEQNSLAERSIRVILDRLRATMQWAQLPYNLWSYILPAVLVLVNCTAVTNRDQTPQQQLLEDLLGSFKIQDLSSYKAIGFYCKVLIP